MKMLLILASWHCHTFDGDLVIKLTSAAMLFSSLHPAILLSMHNVSHLTVLSPQFEEQTQKNLPRIALF